MVYRIDKDSINSSSFEVRAENGQMKNNSYLTVFDSDIKTYIIGKSIVDRTISLDYHYEGDLLFINKNYINGNYPYSDTYIVSKDAYESFVFKKNVMKTIDDIRIKTNADLVIDAYLNHDLDSLIGMDIKLSAGELKDYIFVNSDKIKNYLYQVASSRPNIYSIDLEIAGLFLSTVVIGAQALLCEDVFCAQVAGLTLIFTGAGIHIRRKMIDNYINSEYDNLYEDKLDFKSFTRCKRKK